MFNNFLSTVLLCCGLALFLVSCNPEAFLSADKRGGSGAGSVGETAQVNAYAKGLEVYAVEARRKIVEGDAASGTASFSSGLASVGEEVAGVASGVLSNMRSVYCASDELQVSWMDVRDGAGQFAPKGLGRGGGEKVVAALSGRVGVDQVGVYDGAAVKLVNGDTVAVPATCGSETVSIPVGAPVMVFANVGAADSQTQTAQGYEYHSKACDDPEEQGSQLIRDLVNYVTDADTGEVTKNVIKSEPVSSNCSAGSQTTANIDTSTAAQSSGTVSGTYAGGAGGGALSGALEAGLSGVDCRMVSGVEAGEDTNNDGVVDENDTEEVNTCGDDIDVSGDTYGFDDLSLLPESEWHVFNRDCGGTASSVAVTVNGVNATATYPIYSGSVTYQQKIYKGTTTDANGDEVEVQKTEEPEGKLINCYRDQTVSLACASFPPSDSGNGNTWTSVTGGNFTAIREETVNDGFVEPDGHKVPVQPKPAQFGNWEIETPNCQWNEDRVITASCTDGVNGLERRVHTVTDINGSTTATSWTEVTPVSCPVNGQCGATNNACTAGTLNDTADTGTEYKWECTGEGTGSTAACTMTIPVNGTCGASKDTCSAGTFSDDTDTATLYKWNCVGAGTGSTAACSLNIPVNGQCGTASGVGVYTAPSSNLCTKGTASAVSGSGPWTWSCNGQYGGTNDTSCNAPKAVDGVCGSANGVGAASAPSGATLCSAGTASAVAGSGPWTWSCNGQNGGTNNTSCNAPTAVVNGACGAADGQEVPAQPSSPSDLCSAGEASSVTRTGTLMSGFTYTWSCAGSGVGASASCSATKPFGGGGGGCNITNPQTGNPMMMGLGTYQIWGGPGCVKITCKCDGTEKYESPSMCPWDSSIGDVGCP